ncbi:disease resistance protein RUN1 isoform X2 [Vigna angularis]|uniref:disease resistance protein RUN1 isoform X2 n=1 Tax=Phaseolus angularis TaxID=3914 RepID=UPI0022B365E7|nr:disease resistance protein RUN1 isoform X2 [Vigna angularis]
MSSSSSSQPQWIYDVFINFRGGDTRRDFVSHLYCALSNAGVNTFFDDENLLKGTPLEELTRAIEASQIAIVVFSETYTESTWCLTELQKVIDCNESYGQIVVPIFHGVEPSILRNPKGRFREALEAAAKKKFSEEHREYGLSRWKNVLKKAANFSGWDVKNHRNTAKLVKDIVDDILTKLDYALLSITEFPVGLESRVQEVVGIIENQSAKVCTIGIWGMGGSGKTTMAKAIYNQIHRRFNDKSFIENIREVRETDGRGHVHLQEKLLSDVLKTKVKIHSVGMGTTVIENRLSRKKVFIVLDDVNDFGQLKDLCGNRKWFGKESVIIITTRDLHLLDLLKVDYVYKMEEMDKNESLELFSWHAFREAKPREDFDELARNVVAYCGGLPLALEVLGSYLIERTKKDWESVLLKLEKIPNDQVQEKLRISFDGLCDDMEKDIFLDVCCFFIGKDKAYVIEILNGCGLHADIGITVLIERSLLKVEKNNKLGMHQLLRDMGREIICESSRKDPGKRSRLWFREDVLDVLTKNTGTETIEGLALKSDFIGKDCFKAYAFEEMKKLRLLQLDDVQLTGNYVVIDLKHSNLQLFWKEPQILRWLKILNLSHSKYLTVTPDFSKLPNLEKLILKDCPRLCKVHKSIGGLRNLLLINLEDCKSLGNLPRGVYKLKSVKTLILSGCLKIDRLEDDIVQMESLTTLIAENTAMKQVPFSIVKSKSIVYISLCGFEGFSRNVFPSIIRSWMSPTMNPLSYVHPFCSTSSNLVSMDMQSYSLGDLEQMLSSLSNLRSVLVQCDTESQVSMQVRSLLGNSVNFTQVEISSQISNHYFRSYLIGIGSYQEVFNNLSASISEGLATSESCDAFLPGDNDPFWLAHMGEGNSVYFTVPEDCRMKGMALCVVYLSAPEITATEYLISVLMVNYTRYTIQLFKRETVFSFNDLDWQGIISHSGPGDKVEIFVNFGHGLEVKKTVIYLMCDESIDKEVKPSPEPKKEPKKNVFERFIKKILI